MSSQRKVIVGLLDKVLGEVLGEASLSAFGILVRIRTTMDTVAAPVAVECGGETQDLVRDEVLEAWNE